MISIVTPTLGQEQKLIPLFESLRKQKNFPDFELLLCATQTDKSLLNSLPSLPQAKWIESPEKCISAARNLGIEQAQGDLVLFLDDDCHLPSETYLHDLYSAHQQNPTLSGGGYYLDEEENKNIFSRFYNHLCNLWLHTHLDQKKSPRVLLGGCSFYAKQILMKHNIRFGALNQRAGEEYALNRHVVNEGYDLVLQKRWSVYHNPRCGPRDLFRKAWLQGLSIDQKPSSSPLMSRHFFSFASQKPLQTSVFLPLFAFYYLVGRTAHWKKTFNNSDRKPQAVGQVGSQKVNE